MDGARFDSWIAGINKEAGTRRRIVQILALGATSIAPALLSATDSDAKKKRKKNKKKKRCKKSFAACSGSNKCCSKRCCLEFEGSGRFCGPKGSTCCPDGGACAADSPICCDPDIVPACTTEDYPTCCPANDIVDEPYTCFVGYECCNEEPGCCLPADSLTTTAVSPRGGLFRTIAGK